jgi:hypothetical protein
MKTFKDLREAKNKIPGKKTYDKKVGKAKVTVYKDNKGYTVYIDNDKLDTFKSQKEAEKVGSEFAKEL